MIRTAWMLALVVAVAGCSTSRGTDHGDDTCSGGDNVSSPRLARGLETDGTGAFVTLQWEPGTGRGATLPASYYRAVKLAPEPARLGDGSLPDHGYVDSVTATGDREIVVRLKNLDRLGAADAGASDAGAVFPARVRVLLLFPDRAAHTDCTHPGMTDKYFLGVTLTFSGPTQLDASTFEQRVEVGDI